MAKSQKKSYFYSPEGLSLVKYPGAAASSLLRAAGQALAQRDNGQSELYATDIQGSVLRFMDHHMCSIQYTAYGHDSDKPCASVLRYCGQRRETTTAHYLLGDGYRAFNSVLMRFNAPDSFSPFGAGGMNPYCYCGGDPVNNTDPSGHMLKRIFGRRSSHAKPPMRSSNNPTVQMSAAAKRPTEYSSNDIGPFASHLADRPSETFKELIAYQGKGSGEWVDVLISRNSYTKADLPLVEGVKVSLSRDAQRLVADLQSHPASTSGDPRYVAAQKLIDGLGRVERLEDRIKSYLARERAMRNWHKLVDKIRNPG